MSGQQSGAGRVDDGYILAGPVLPGSHAAIRAWRGRSPTGGGWHAIDVFKQWRLDQDLSDPVWSPDPAYLNQVCADLIRPTYLTAPLPSAQYIILGRETVNGHQVWHLRERPWFTLDLFVDAHSFRLLRLVLGDRPGSTSRWQDRFTYSQFNAPVHIALPTRGQHGR